SDAAGDPGLREDRLRELGPCAVTGRGEVPDAERQLEHLARRRREMADVRGRAPLIVDDGDLVPLDAEPQHRPDEVRAGRPVEAGAADDPRLLTGGRLAVELAPAVRGQRARRVRPDVRLM